MKNDERASAVLELALVLPVLVLVVFGGLEFSQAMNRRQISAALSREVASLVYRECVSDIGGDPRRANTLNPITNQNFSVQMTNCLETQRNSVLALSHSLVPETEILVGVYRYDVTQPARSRAVDFHSSQLGTHATKFSWQGSSDEGRVGMSGGAGTSMLNTRSYLVIGEAFVPYTPVVRFIWQFTPQAVQVFYDATIL